jgi:hypothetical protein
MEDFEATFPVLSLFRKHHEPKVRLLASGYYGLIIGFGTGPHRRALNVDGPSYVSVKGAARGRDCLPPFSIRKGSVSH